MTVNFFYIHYNPYFFLNLCNIYYRVTCPDLGLKLHLEFFFQTSHTKAINISTVLSLPNVLWSSIKERIVSIKERIVTIKEPGKDGHVNDIPR